MNITNSSRAHLYEKSAYRNRNMLRTGSDYVQECQANVSKNDSTENMNGKVMSVQDIYERMTGSASKSPAASSEETKTKSEIIVKPDGSRVLVMTTNIGGMQTQMSMEISKPTNMLDDGLEQMDENDGTPDAQTNMVLDGDLDIIQEV